MNCPLGNVRDKEKLTLLIQVRVFLFPWEDIAWTEFPIFLTCKLDFLQFQHFLLQRIDHKMSKPSIFEILASIRFSVRREITKIRKLNFLDFMKTILFMSIRKSLEKYENSNIYPLTKGLSYSRLCNHKAYGAVAERLRPHSREQTVPSLIPRLDISVEVTSMLISIGLYMFNVVCAAKPEICRIALVS